jgi:hypothetical protein
LTATIKKCLGPKHRHGLFHHDGRLFDLQLSRGQGHGEGASFGLLNEESKKAGTGFPDFLRSLLIEMSLVTSTPAILLFRTDQISLRGFD